jgi:hypothetical protein
MDRLVARNVWRASRPGGFARRGDGPVGRPEDSEYVSVPLKRLSDGLGLPYKAVHRTPLG